ncbi:protein FAR1-RELATED SEQUENCE 5-like [Miscanthus floridulus]|uniref:protein FAR1-RELATED SEQUENCE 5-like n=1 Tax=Miscanthus floridulus TaxID=154761 RepID=UPI00345A6561
MQFESSDEAYKFYNNYALIVGFSIVMAHNYHSRDKKMMGQVTRMTFKCQRREIDKQEENKASGQQRPGVQSSTASRKRKNNNINTDEAAPTPAARKKRCNVIDKTNCPAEMIITLKNKVWVVSRLNLEHNHNLLSPELSKLLRSHRHFTEQEKAMIRTFVSVNVPNRKILAFLSYLRGGMQFTNLVKTDISNYRTRMLRECGESDISQVIQFLRMKQTEDPLFFFAFDAGEDNKVRNLFWAYGNSRASYEEYGDVISFDTTYATNRYNLKFAPFVGINGHGNNMLFAGAVLSDETIPTFRWLFRTFLVCMGGKAPKSIITDQDATMRSAIGLEFKDTVHRNCLFHIVSKAEIFLGTALSKNEDFAWDFYDIIYNSLTIEEFETLWNNMLDKHNVQHLKFLKVMYENRERFVPVYFKHNFFPFICSTSRSEGTNAIFKDNVGPTSSLIMFIKEYDRIVKNMDEKGNLRDKNKAQEKAILYSTYTFKRQARDYYNTQIFYRFQQLLKTTGKYVAEEHEKDKIYVIYKS